MSNGPTAKATKYDGMGLLGAKRTVFVPPSLGWLLNSGVLLATGIAKPERFILDIQEKGLRIIRKVIVGDHEHFSESQFSGVNAPIVITEKDYYRDSSFFKKLEKSVFVLPVETKMSDQDFGKLEKYF